ncbi:RNA 3'-terminal phosphate cyclase-domain-containing protein [Phlyctochytrium arcticum]|nr:RNA 3'-terminal phosphate cyclase-domain-containing protein [Phlyctochytrium arcticum]
MRHGEKHRKRENKLSAENGVHGVDAWSKNSLADFDADQQLVTASQVAFSVDATASASSVHTTSLVVDGSLLEGGGQVLRNSVAYAALLAMPIHIINIRAGRGSGGGLKAQHLMGLCLVHEITGGSLRGADLNSREVQYLPGDGDFSHLKYRCDVRSAGAIGLIGQVSIPVCLFFPHPVELTLCGGTNASMAPVIDFSMLVFAPIMQQQFGVAIDFSLVKRGFFPKGGGEVKVRIQPIKQLKAIQLVQRGTIEKIAGFALVTHRLPAHISRRIADTCTELLRKQYGTVEIDIHAVIVPEEEAPLGDGVSLILRAHTSTGCILGASALGGKGKPAEDVARHAVDQLVANLNAGGCVDEYMQDQLILFCTLAKGISTIKTGPITLHTRTCLFWAQRFLPRCQIRVSSDTAQTFIIEIQGIGYESRFKAR